MSTYIGVIYFRNGNVVETGGFSGPGAEKSCEMHTAAQFEMYRKSAISPFFEPTRYIVKEKK